MTPYIPYPMIESIHTCGNPGSYEKFQKHKGNQVINQVEWNKKSEKRYRKTTSPFYLFI